MKYILWCYTDIRSLPGVSFLKRCAAATLIIKGLINFRLGNIGLKSVWCPLSISLCDLPEVLLAKKISQSTPHLENGIVNSIQSGFKIKILPCTCNRYSWLRTYILMPDVKEITVAEIVEEEIRVRTVLLSTVVIGTAAWLFIGGKESDIMSLIR